MSRGEGLADGIVPWTDLYGAVQGVVVARASVQHRLTEALAQTGGHIGYAVRPEYRRRGYATALLRAGLVIAPNLGIDRGLVTCDQSSVDAQVRGNDEPSTKQRGRVPAPSVLRAHGIADVPAGLGERLGEPVLHRRSRYHHALYGAVQVRPRHDPVRQTLPATHVPRAG